MANVKKSARVVDADIVRLNHVGLSLKAIATLLGCHPATITLRLNALGVKPSDTRRSFMEQVFAGLTDVEQDWLSHFLFNNELPIATFITALIKDAHVQAPLLTAAPVEQPELVENVMVVVEPELVTETRPALVVTEGEPVEPSEDLFEETPAEPQPTAAIFG